VVAAAGLAAVLAGCGGGSEGDPAGGPPSPSTHGTTAGSPVGTGAADHPTPVSPGTDLLGWKPVPGPSGDLVTVGDGWTLAVPQDGHEARLRGPRRVTIRAPAHSSVTDAFLDRDHALVVSEDDRATEPARAVVVDLRSGRTTTLDAHVSPPTAVGGTWALGPDRVVHATPGPRHTYCLATVDLTTRTGDRGWCAEPRHGFSRAAATDAGTSMMTFDAHHPSCRTLVEVEDDAVTPLPGVPGCLGWDSLLLDDGAVWSVVPHQRRIEVAHLYAHTATGWWDLGRGTSGTLVGCAGAAYFVRDPHRSSDPARLLRWEGGSADLSVVFASRGRGRAFLAAPRCGGDHLTVSAFSSAGDQQVTAQLN
jgi:hypothetical protein